MGKGDKGMGKSRERRKNGKTISRMLAENVALKSGRRIFPREYARYRYALTILLCATEVNLSVKSENWVILGYAQTPCVRRSGRLALLHLA